MRHLIDLPVLVLGLGASGLAMARWCAAHGASVTVWDSREAPPGLDALRAEWPTVTVTIGALAPAALDGVRMVLKSPGLAPSDERIAAVLAAARATGIAIGGELDLFAHALADLKAERGYAPQVLAVTGTNGKTTVTSLTTLLVARAGRRVASAGNIGPTMLDTLAAALREDEAARGADGAAEVSEAVVASTANPGEQADMSNGAQVQHAEGSVTAAVGAADLDAAAEGTTSDAAASLLPQVWVLELSSFQLDGVRHFDPHAAVVLNLTEDHLDWHGSMEAYAKAKARIWGPGTTLVVNRNDARVEAAAVERLAELSPPPKSKAAARRATMHAVVRFGLDAPRAPGDFGLVVEGGMAWLVRAQEAEVAPRRRASAASNGEGEVYDDLHLQRLMPADALRIRGRHNAANALAALALATAVGCPLAPMLHGLREYTGEPHRVEFVARIDEVDAYDDSKGTNVGATVAALEGLGADLGSGKLLVILGGDGKGQDFTPLAAPIQRHARGVALIGRDAEAIAHALASTGVPMQRHPTLEAATAWCFEQARAGDAVLLSPACASLDMFRNYAHRAEVFVAAVRERAGASGVAA